MEQSPNHLEPLKQNAPQGGKISAKSDPAKSPSNSKKKQRHSDQPATGKPVLGSDKGPWKGTD